MKRLPSVLALIASLLLISITATAADYFARVFEDMDLNQDGYVSLDEYEYYKIGASGEAYDRLDLTGDGKLELFEWVAHEQELDPKVHEYRYRCQDRNGDVFYHENNAWYRISDGFLYKFQNREWEKQGRVLPRPRYYEYPDRHWYPYDDYPFGYHHGHFRHHRDHFGFGFRFGFSD